MRRYTLARRQSGASLVAQPTIADRLRRRFIVISGDAALLGEFQDALPAGWEMTSATGLAQIGKFQEVLLHRFILLDLDEVRTFDPLQIVRELRSEMMLNVPIFCFGGSPEMRDGGRLARADRFFERDEIVERMKSFCEQYGWGG